MLNLKDVPVGVPIVVIFPSLLGDALFVSVGRNGLTDKLTSNLTANLPQVSSCIVIQTRANDLRNVVAPQQIGALLEAYNEVLVHKYMVSLVLSCRTISITLWIQTRLLC